MAEAHMMLVLVGVLALLIGALIGALLARSGPLGTLKEQQARYAEVEQALTASRDAHHEAERFLAEREALLERERDHTATLAQQRHQLEQDSARLRSRVSELETSLKKDQAHYQERVALLEQARDQLKAEFQQLAGKIFDERSQRFSTQSRADLTAMLTPLREQLQEFRTRLEGINEKDIQRQSSLRAQLEQLGALNRQISEDATNLTKALKGDSKMQGQWGELMLETVLERSGLRKGIEYQREVAFTTEEGRRRPDAIIKLPEQRHLVVDAKVSLHAYGDYIAAEDDAARAAALRRHLRSVRAHMEGLAGRDYARLPGLNSPDMVFMFMPIEAAFSLAFEHDDQLFHDAFSRNVVIVTPTTLLASLRTVANLWRLEQHNENARLIVKRGEMLLDKFVGFVDSIHDIGTHLARANASQQQALKRLSDGQGSLVSQAQALSRLGVRSKKQLPSYDADGEEDDTETP
ncbi:DNA recombination protein RmuC [Carnimonas bestiolae]|uniref:DNA recombination protein RmuC n=1 Tax=Carnimonas bestiolae TaxID=3402172 RepID=UPI003EDBAA26